jgi:acyl carrier protein
MTREDTRVALQRIFEDVFGDSPFEFSDGLSRESLPAWDSLGHIRLIAATEDAFDIRFTIEEIEKLTSVGRMVERIDARS